MMIRSGIIVAVIGYSLIVCACAKIAIPTTIDDMPIREHAQIEEKNGVRVSVALVDDSEAAQIFGIDLSSKNIQAIWIEIENNIDRPLLLLPTSIDPDYFPPLEVAYSFHKSFSAEKNKALDEHLLKLYFPARKLVEPGKRMSGYIFLPGIEGLRVIDIDLVGDKISRNFTFFTSSTGFYGFREIEKRIQSLSSKAVIDQIHDEAMLRSSLAQLPCCVSTEPGGQLAEPVNLVIISTLDNLVTAFGRRGFRYKELSPRYLFGRVQDFSGGKVNHWYVRSQAHTLRLWRTAINYQGTPVWVGQTSSRLGGRFAGRKKTEKTLPMEPYVDESREDITQDLAYSQALVRIGYVKGAGEGPESADKTSTGDDLYKTDGLRVVMVLGDRPASLGTIDFFGWEVLAEFSQTLHKKDEENLTNH